MSPAASFLPLAIVPIAWLLPNHYVPWPSAWQDGVALALLAAAALWGAAGWRLPRAWCAVVALALASIGWQAATGVIVYGGDALMAALYVLAFALAMATGAAGGGADAPRRAELLALGLLAGAVASAGIAFAQWTHLYLGLWIVEPPPAARPFGNVAQQNHLCTIAFLGIAAAGLLHEARRIGRATMLLAWGFLGAGMVLSGSRTGWLQMALLLLVVPVFRRTGARSGAAAIGGLGAAFAAVSLAWPRLSEALLLSAGTRSLAEQADAGLRWPLWRAMAEAIAREPWRGYGWQQTVFAQRETALEHPLQRHFEHAHSLPLDLLIWAGIPVGVAILAMGGIALATQARAVAAARNTRGVWLLAAVGGVLVHALVEFPIEYAYFLIPLGACIGLLHALAPVTAFRVPRGPAVLLALSFAAAFVAVAVEYVEAESAHRMLRLESARIGTDGVATQPPDLKWLTQLRSFQALVATEARPGMAPSQVDAMRSAARRFAYPPAMLRYALAAGLNGRPDAAHDELRRLCAMHPPARCSEAREAWVTLQRRYPALASVPAP